MPSERAKRETARGAPRAFERRGSTAESGGEARRRVPLRIHEPVLEALAADSETASPRALLPEAASPIGVTPRPIAHERLESPLATLSASRSPRRIVAGDPGRVHAADGETSPGVPAVLTVRPLAMLGSGAAYFFHETAKVSSDARSGNSFEYFGETGSR